MPSLRALTNFIRPYRLWALLAPVLMLLEVVMDLKQPHLMQLAIDQGIKTGDLALVRHCGLLMLVCALVGLVGGAGCTWTSSIAGIGLGADLRAALMRKVQSLGFAELDALQTGRLVTRLTNDVEQVQEATMMILRIMVRAPLLVLGGLVMAIRTYPALAPIIIVVSPLLVAVFVVISRRGHDLYLAVQEGLDRVNVVLQENLAAARLVRAFVRAKREQQRFGGANEELMTRNIRASVLVATTIPAMILILNVAMVAALWLGGRQVIQGYANLGQLLAFNNYLMQILFSLAMIGMFISRIVQADASAERVLGVLRTQPAIDEPAVPSAPPPAAGEVVFEQVTCGYDGDAAEPVLADLSFRVEPGTTLAIVGATGSGKSTLAHLVPRFYDPRAGRILLDGVDLRDWRQADLRERVALVAQETVLFSGTIRDNLAWGRPGASDEEVRRAAELAQAADFIAQQPDGYDTVLGQRGAGLSGGQRQRLSLARALLCEPSVLILDDCTSAVDATTEAALLRALAGWEHRCTRLVIAQRVGTFRGADRILLLDDGRVAALGTHRELLAGCPAYRELVRSQLGDEELGDE